MIHPANKLILVLFVAVLLSSCKDKRLNNNIPEKMLPGVQFAMEHIEKACGNASYLSSDKVSFTLDSVGLEEQEYSIAVSGKNIRVRGGGSRGLMYGGLEVAEQIELYGRVEDCLGSPFIENRGVKFNIPLDARTPGFDDTGDAAQKNITEMWSWEFWDEYLGHMALNRYNVLSLWNPHPFPSMIRMEEYPDMALDDVYKTTLQPVGEENEWGDPGLVSSNVMENLERVAVISMDDKIRFWQKVMKRAADLGIDIYWITWNICPNSVAPPVDPYYRTYEINLGHFEEGKYGVTYEISNPVTIEYHRKAVEQFLLTYPDVKGIGATAGEHMPLNWEGYNREQWLWESYGMGILDAKAQQPGREVRFIHRVWHSDMDQIMNYWKDYPDPFDVSFKYAKARLYSSTKLPFADSHMEEMESYGLDSWWNLRNDDIFVHRWGDPDYVRDFLGNLPSEHTAGYYVGSDGYVWAREFISLEPELSGEVEVEKHWYRFMLWGRLGYDRGLDRNFFIKHMEKRYGLDDAGWLYDVWQSASGIIPMVNRFHWRDWDTHWAVEGCMARPRLGGFRDVFDFMNNPTLEGSGILTPMEFAVNTLAGEAQEEGISPLEIADSLELFAEHALLSIKSIEPGFNQAEYRTLLQN